MGMSPQRGTVMSVGQFGWATEAIEGFASKTPAETSGAGKTIRTSAHLPPHTGAEEIRQAKEDNKDEASLVQRLVSSRGPYLHMRAPSDGTMRPRCILSVAHGCRPSTTRHDSCLVLISIHLAYPAT